MFNVEAFLRAWFELMARQGKSSLPARGLKPRAGDKLPRRTNLRQHKQSVREVRHG